MNYFFNHKLFSKISFAILASFLIIGGFFISVNQVNAALPVLSEPNVVPASSVRAGSAAKVIGAFSVTNPNGPPPDSIDQFKIQNKVGLTATASDVATVAIYADTGTLGVLDGDSLACAQSTTSDVSRLAGFTSGISPINFTCYSPIVIGAGVTNNYLVVVVTSASAIDDRTMAANIDASLLSEMNWAISPLSTTNSIKIANPTVTITSSPTINNANKTAYTVSGTCSENGRTVSVVIGSMTPVTPTCTALAWTTGAIDVSAVTDSPTLAITANHNDSELYAATEATASVVKDTIAPASPTIDIVATDDIINAVERTATVTVTGTNEAGSTVTLNGNATTPLTGTTWNYVLTISAINAFGQGVETLTAIATDTAGNVNAANGTRSISINTIPTSENTVFTNDATVSGGTSITVVSAGEIGGAIWFAPSGTTTFVTGNTMTTAGGTATSILAPASDGTYKLYVVDVYGYASNASTYTLTVINPRSSGGGGGGSWSVAPIKKVTPVVSDDDIIKGCSGGNIFNTSTGKPCTNNTGITTKRVYALGTVILKNGSKGEAVKELQRFLNDKLSLGLVVDGNLGPKTIAVIKAWQKQNGLVADGLIGPKTKALMNQ